MKVDITVPPDPDIFRDRKKHAVQFAFFMFLACVSIGIGVFVVYFDTHGIENVEDWALGLLVGSSFGITWSGNRLQAYKKLYPPHLKKIGELRGLHPAIEEYCGAVEALQRRMIRAEYEACVDYSEKHSAIPFI